MTRSGLVTSMSPVVGDHAGGDFGRAGRAEVKPLGPLAFHLERDLLDVEHDVGDVLADARRALENSWSTPSILIEVTAAPWSERQQHAAQRVAERHPEAALQRLGDEHGAAAAVAAADCFFSSALGFFSSCQFFALTAMFIPWQLAGRQLPDFKFVSSSDPRDSGDAVDLRPGAA